MEQPVLFCGEVIRKGRVERLQINMGNRCNQSCAHCHIVASPRGEKVMAPSTAEGIIRKLIETDIREVEFTGGTPELNPSLPVFIRELSLQGKNISVRTSLTVLDSPEYIPFMDLYRRHRVKVIASLPGLSDEADSQRGKGVFKRSIRILKMLNSMGYGEGGLGLDLVYNPVGAFLPPSQEELEREYKAILKDEYGIRFNSLITIVNSPVGRFRDSLIRNGSYDSYLRLLSNNFNSATLDRVMCRSLLSVDYRGELYDCDFNLALGLPVKGYEGMKLWEIDLETFHPEISCGEHCYACTVGMGSSCYGALISGSGCSGLKEEVKRYYGEELKGTKDLRTGACCSPDSIPAQLGEILPLIADEIKEKYYGCGSPVPLCLHGRKVLDLGCGTGRDSYLISRLVGQDGRVFGLDMTEEQIRVARKYLPTQTAKFGYREPNTEFIHDYIENAGRHFPDESLDVVVSNCVINLVEDKERVIGEVYRLLKKGGEFYFSDIYADRRIPGELKKDPVLYGECLSGALYQKDFERIARKAGFSDPRIVSLREVPVTDREIAEKVGTIRFFSVTYRLWKLDGLEGGCEDYGHMAVYRGGIPEAPARFVLDEQHVFERNRPERICGNTALMLSATRFRDFFEVSGDFSEHFGEFRGCGMTASLPVRSSSFGCC